MGKDMGYDNNIYHGYEFYINVLEVSKLQKNNTIPRNGELSTFHTLPKRSVGKS